MSGLTEAQVLLSQHWKDSLWDKATSEVKLLAQDACERDKQAGKGVQAQNKEGCVFIIKEKGERGEDHLLPYSGVDIMAYIISSLSNAVWSNRDFHSAI